MAKAVLISIRPEWCEKIARGEKTVEVRKTRPKLDTPFKCYIYCTKGNDARRLRGSWGKVIGEFICDRVETIKTPKPLSEFKGLCKIEVGCGECPYYNYTKMECDGRTIKRPPQSWCYVEELK